MHDAVRRDPDLHFPHLIVVSASAGSGKTTALTERYVRFLLSDRVQFRQPQHLLAITFTKNAAAQMKQRILEMLRSLALGKQPAVGNMAALTGARDDQVVSRADRALETILDGYSDFNVRTIDSFLTNVVRSSAVELGLSPNVDVRLDARPVLMEAFRSFSRNTAGNADHLGILRQLADLAEEGRSAKSTYLWDPYGAIARRVTDLYADLATTALPVRVPALKQAEDEAVEAARKAAEALREVLTASGLSVNAHLAKDLNDIQAGNLDAVFERTIKSKAVNKPGTKAQKEAAARYGETIDASLTALNGALGEIVLLKARQYFSAYALTLSLISDHLAEKKEADNIILLDDINRVLRSYLTEETVPELYIKLGEAVHHYLVDEFQDTSPAQWEALKPLFENTVSTGGSLFFVGDMKQSIFGFRGADWRVMKRVLETDVFPSAPRTPRTLSTNYRSRKELVEAVRSVFHDNVAVSDFHAAAEATGLRDYTLEPNPEETRKGFVEVRHVSPDAGQDAELAQVVEFVGQRHDRGHRWGDIAVLTPANEDVVRISSALNTAGIPSVSQSSLDIRNRKVIAELISCLRFLDAPVDDAAFGTFLLGDILRAVHPEITSEAIRNLIRLHAEDRGGPALYVRFREHFAEAWSESFEALYQHVGYLPLYDLVCAMVGTFRLFEHFPAEQASLVRLLECVREFESEGSNAVRDFLREASSGMETVSWELPRPSGDDAVTLMTIHKAKGLGFPVVAVLLYPWKRTGGEPVFLEVEGEAELLHVTGKNAERHPTLKTMYEEQILRWQADKLNTLYVSLTRAQEEMLVLVVADDATKAPASLLPPSRTGEPDRLPERTPAATPTPLVMFRNRTDFPVQERRRLLKERELRRGERIHLVLSKLHTVEDPAADLSVALGLAPPWDADLEEDDVRTTLLRFLEDPMVRPLFGGGGTILVEYAIADRTGGLHRVDRAVVGDDEIVVIDFKTGGTDMENEYTNQVREYMGLLGALYPGKRVRGVLAYVDRCAVVAVNA